MLTHLPGGHDLARAIAENSVHGIVVMDEDGFSLYANRAWTELTGFSQDEMAGKPVHDWVHHTHPDGRPFPIHECPIGCTLGRRENLRDYREVFFRKDGSRLPVACSASTIDAPGQLLLKILEIRDIGIELEGERRRDEFLAMLAHELRNPLAPISAAAELLALSRGDARATERASAVIIRQVQHMTGLVDDLLDVSRVTRGQIELTLRELDVHGVVAEATEQVRPLIDARRHQLALRGNAAPAPVLGDRKRLVQVLANLLSNAAKYTPEGGRIAVEVTAGPGQVRIDVTDNGIGMTEELTRQAFDLFTQARRTSDRTQGGLGIGLALVRNLVSLHGGKVWAESPGLGLGTTLVLTLPAASPPGGAAADSGEAAPADAAAPLRVMVVDDSHDVADMIGMLMGALGHAVRIETDPLLALEAAGKETFDAFLLDLGLPGIDGMELARRFRQQPHNAQAMLVAITGYGREQDRRHSADAGFDHHLVKPASLDQIGSLLGAAPRRTR
jgi:PAS domain S-box-containing protein